MRVVLDTNVVVSAAFFGGLPRRVVDAWIGGEFEVVLSPLIFDEYPKGCHRLSSSYSNTDFQPLLTAFLAHGHLIDDRGPGDAVTRDPADDKFMRCALRAEAVVVSGDRHLLEVDGWQGVSVLTPAELLDKLGP